MTDLSKRLYLLQKDFDGQLIGVIEKEGIDGNFLLSCILVDWLLWSKNNRAVFLSFHHTCPHYYQNCRKLGVNITNRTKFIPVSYQIAFEQTLSDVKDLTKRFYDIIVEEIDKSSDPVLVVIDSVSHLLELGCDDKQICVFLHYLRTLLRPSVSVVVLCKSSVVHQAFLERISNVTLTVSPFTTGPSKDATGLLVVSKKEEMWLPSSNLYHFRLTDRNVTMFPPGNLLL